jgi:tetratricopeptide (TPR) repeat protein
MEIKPQMSQAPTVWTGDQKPVDAVDDKKSGEQEGNATPGNAETTSSTVHAMKQAGTETKGSIKTSANFRQQSLNDQFERKVSQNEDRSGVLLRWPKSDETGSSNATPLLGSPVMSANTQTVNAPATAKSAGDPMAAARKEAQVLMDHGNKMLKEHRYNEALEAYQQGFRTYPHPAFILNEASTLLDAGRYSEAVMAYERYLSDPDAPRADEARAAMERAKAAMGGREATITGVVESRNQFEKGAEAFKAGRYQEALDAFDKAYELNPLADFKYNQAAALEKLGRPYAAADRLQGYLDAKPGARDTVAVTDRMNKLRAEADKAPITATGLAGGQEWMSRGNRLLHAHRYDEAVKAYEEGFRTYPDSKFILNKASALLDGGRYAEADLAYQRYLSDPKAERADEARAAQARARAHLNGREANITDEPEARRLYDVGATAYKEGRYEEALDAFERAYEKKPLPEFKYNQGAALEKLGRPYAAADRYSQYAAEKPNAADAQKVAGHAEKLRTEADKAPITASGLAGGQEWMSRGNRLLQAHRYDEAVKAYEEGFRTYPDSKFILNKASALLDGGRYAEADLAYQTYLSDPNAARADEAQAAQARARAHMPGGREATATGVADSQKSFQQGNDLYKAGKYNDAFQAFERAYAQNPLGALRYNQAAALDKMGKRELAAQRYEAYLAETPNAPDAAQVRAHITKLRADALKASQSAFDRGQEAYVAGRFNEAASAFAEAYEQKPLPQFLYNIATSYDMAGDTMRAVQNYQLYLSMSPDAKDADKVRQHIHKLLKATGADLMQPGS